VRELQNSMESAVVMARGSAIELHDLPPAVRSAEDEPAIRLLLGSTLDQGERAIIRATLSHQQGNKSRTAEVLGISRKTLHRKMREYQLED
jgi:DNA-binding NtrC family response regulator